MYTLKSIAQRGAAIVGALAVFLGVVSFPVATYAASTYSALNPLTNRSLTLSSSSPGWASTDGSGNTTYAPPNSGANGQKTGETFSFVTSSDATTTPLEAFTFQYCTQPAGDCLAPGNDTGAIGSRTDSVANQQSDLNVVTSSPTEMSAANYAALSTNQQTSASDDDVNNYTYTGLPDVDNSQGNFVVIVTPPAGTATVSSGWSMEAANNEDTPTTGKNNYITLYNSTGASVPAHSTVQVIFYATNTNYITNPGSGAFFVKINDYTGLTTTGTAPDQTTTADASTILDGGVTVANVMNQSIQITTKVLETMAFSVGTVDPDTLTDAQLKTASDNSITSHGQCDPILTSFDGNPGPNSDVNVLTMGNTATENSLSTQNTYATHSYWRLSSNSSAGATVYYSGNTLANTEGNEITPIGTTAAIPSPGSEQFGLALDTVGASPTGTGQIPYGVDWSVAANGDEQGADTNGGVTGGVDSSFTTDTAKWNSDSVSKNSLAPLLPSATYANGSGTINPTTTGTGGDTTTTPPTAEFAFNENSTAVPVALATENSAVVNCVTAKVRYIANIAATTPAGIYTTKINYIAAPQY